MRTSRPSNFLYLVMGALSVAIVAAVLVASGVFDRADATAHVEHRDRHAGGARPSSTSSAAVPTDVSDIYRRSPPASSTSPPPPPRARPPARAGSYGADGTIVTNDHVVEGARKRLRPLHRERRPDPRQGRRHRPVDRRRAS